MSGDTCIHCAPQIATFMAENKLDNGCKMANDMHGNEDGIFRVKTRQTNYKMYARSQDTTAPSLADGLPRVAGESPVR